MTNREGPVKEMIFHKAVLFSIGLIGIVFLMVQCGPGLNAPGGSYPQILVGAASFSGGNFQGKIYYFNSVNGYLELSIVGESSTDFFGKSVSTAGDFNGDGFDDIVVGANNAAGGFGKVYVYSGDGAELFSEVGEAGGDDFGSSVSTAGDFNGDGFGDIVVGARAFNGTAGSDVGKVYVYAGPDGTELFSREGQNNFDLLGDSVSTAGDFDRDGFDDIVVGASGFPAAASRGKIYVYSGSDGSELFSKEGEFDLDKFGESVGSTRGLIKRIPKLP